MPICLRFIFVTLLAVASGGAHAADLTVSAAASLTNAFRELGSAFETRNPGTQVVFNFAASDALEKAVHEAGAVLLEPIMKLEVVTPNDYLGDIMADLLARRAEISDTYDRGKLRVVEARAPLEKMFGYSTAVRSLSQGRASYSMEPLEYAPAPESMLEILGG